MFLNLIPRLVPLLAQLPESDHFEMILDIPLMLWVRQGLLPYQAEKNKKLVDEADLAYLVNLSQAKKIRQGRKFTVPNVNT